MTEGQLRRARKLIRRLCANYDEGNCLALDEGEGCVCVQSISYSLLCRYFKEAVLPADAELCAAIGQGADELKRCRSLNPSKPCLKPLQNQRQAVPVQQVYNLSLFTSGHCIV